MATLEATIPSQHPPGMSVLASERRPGYKIFDIKDLFPDQTGINVADLVRLSSEELSTGGNDTYLPPLPPYFGRQDYHHAFAGESTDFMGKGLQHTELLLGGLTAYIRSMARDPEFSRPGADGESAAHAGLAAWSPTLIELDRHSGTDVLGDNLPDYRRGIEAGRVITALVQLGGSRELAVKLGEQRPHSPLLYPGQVALFRAPGLREGSDATAPDFRFARISGATNNLTMTVMNRTVEAPAAA